MPNFAVPTITPPWSSEQKGALLPDTKSDRFPPVEPLILPLTIKKQPVIYEPHRVNCI
jgi:hypothetical protein